MKCPLFEAAPVRPWLLLLDGIELATITRRPRYRVRRSTAPV
jgi:hypothetical protein